MLQAEKKGLTGAIIENIYEQHLADIDDFSIDFDDFYGTHSPESEKVVQTIFTSSKHCSEREIEQAATMKSKCFCQSLHQRQVPQMFSARPIW